MTNASSYKIVSFFPENFFSKEVNEPFIKDILEESLDIHEWRQGNPNVFEPDYFADNILFEFTLASDSKKKNNFIQKMMQGTYESVNIESDVFAYIEERIADKATRKYSVGGICLCVLCLLDLFNWVSDEYGSVFHVLTDYPRKQFFEMIKRKYINTGIFNNIYIAIPDMCGKWWTFDVLMDIKVPIVITPE